MSGFRWNIHEPWLSRQKERDGTGAEEVFRWQREQVHADSKLCGGALLVPSASVEHTFAGPGFRASL